MTNRDSPALPDQPRRPHAGTHDDRWLDVALSRLPVTVWEVDRNLTILASHGSLLARLGLAPNEVVGRTLQQYFGSDDLSHPVIHPHVRALAGESGVFEHHAAGMHLDVRVEPVTNASGVIDGCIGIAWDITERVRADESRRRLATAVAQSIDGIAIADMDGALLYVNQAWTRMHGYEPGELIGQSLLICHTHEQVATDVAPFLGHIRREGGHTAECGHVRKDGTIFRTLLASTLVYSESGNPSGYVAVAHDLTGRLERERQHRLLSAAIEQAHAGVAMTDTEGTITYANPAYARLWGGDPKTALGTRAREFAAAVADAAWVPPDAARPEEPCWSGVLTLPAPSDSQPMLTQTRVSAVRDASGALTNFVVTSSDVTREAALERRVREAQKLEAVGTLAGGIAHEFNNILTAVIGFADSALLHIEEPLRARGDLGEVIVAGERAAVLVDWLLRFSRGIEGGAGPVVLGRVVEDVVSIVRASIPTTFNIELDLRADQEKVLGDAAQLRQAVLNLCTNAWQAMKAQGAGTLRLALDAVADLPARAATLGAPAGQWLRLSVSDTGVGIPPGVLHRVFEPFFTTRPIGEGSGLGLSAAHGIVTALGGVIDVSSTPDHGSTFSIYLPCAGSAAPPSAPVDLKEVGGDEHLLVADDDDGVSRLLEAMLTSAGYRVTMTSTGVDALQAFIGAPEAFDLVLTDQTMPELTGLQLARTIRGMRDLPIILLTGYSDVLLPNGERPSHVDKVLGKPFSKPLLLRAVRESLDRKKETACHESC